MGLFSTTPDLHPEVQEALSPEFHAGIIGTRDYNPGIRKLANAQERLREALRPAEELVTVMPSVRQGACDGIAVLTDQRVFTFKRRIDQELAIERVVDSSLSVHPGGFVIIQLFGDNYLPYSAGMSNAQLELLRTNHVQIYAPIPSLARHFDALVRGERDRARQ